MRYLSKYVPSSGLAAAAMALGGLVLAACGGSSTPAPTTAAPAAAARAPKPTIDPAVANANKNMAAGVPIGDTAAPVETRFDLAAVPVPGASFAVHVAVMPSAPAPLLRLDVTGSEGLVVLSPDVQVTHEKVAAGTVVPLEIRAQSAEAGSRVLYVKAILEFPDGPQAKTFGFPILVGPAPAPAKPATAAKSAR